MEDQSFYHYFQRHLTADFKTVRVLKEDTDTKILLLRHCAGGELFVLRDFSGSSAIYRKLMTVSSEYLPRIYEVAEEAGRLLVLEEYIQGDALDSILEQGVLPKKQVRRIMLQLCNALHVLHGFEAVHRDIKPENIILRGDEAVLIDFDASRMQKPTKTTDTVILGTVGYAAPEQYGISQTDQRADIYALGVLMNVMLTGEHPSVRLAKGHMGHVIRRCTMTNPEERYRDVSYLAEAL
ncbi:MAG: serine/threonine protein kinase [Oscillospiraceae bacterium]|nr:serine/threonine protein kinase [Oscillospiraceae bacterium]